MSEEKFRAEYKEVFREINAGHDLKKRVMELADEKASVQRKINKPLIASVASLAAAVAVFAAVQNLPVKHGDEGVISETVKTADTDTVKRADLSPYSSGAVYDGQQQKDLPLPANERKQTQPPAPTRTPLPEIKDSASQVSAEEIEKKALRQAQASHRKAEQISQSGSVHSYDEPATVPVPLSADERADSIAQTALPDMSETGSPQATETSEMESAAVLLRVGNIVLRMNSTAAFSSIMPKVTENAQETEQDFDLGELEEWDNNRYFDYIGKNVTECMTNAGEYVYIGDNSAYFMVNTHGEPVNASRIFAYENGDIRANILTSTDKSAAMVYLTDESLLKSSVSGTEAVVFDMEDRYKCYMIIENISYILDVYSKDISVLEDILSALI